MKKEKSCKDCLMGVRINVNTDILCRLKGVVSTDYVCPKHKPAPVHILKKRNESLRCIDCEYFTVDGVSPDNLPTIGFCQMFTVRHYNGEFKKACSKYCMKNQLDESLTG